MLIRVGRHDLSIGRCRGQRRPAYHAWNGCQLHVWLPGWAITYTLDTWSKR